MVPPDLLVAAESMSYPGHAASPQPPPPPREKLLQALESVQPPRTPPLIPLYKQQSWSPDIIRNEAWLRKKGNREKRRSKSVTDEDLDELKACIELGFGFDSPEAPDQRLSDTLPALGLYQAVNKNYNDTISKHTTPSPSAASDSDSNISSPIGSPHAIFGPEPTVSESVSNKFIGFRYYKSGDNPQMVKTKLRQWAQVVACSVRQSS